MNIIAVIKPVTTVVASIGVGAVIGNIIKATTPVEVTLVQKVAIGVGAFVLVNVLGDLAARSIHETVDNVAEGVEVIKETVEAAKASN